MEGSHRRGLSYFDDAAQRADVQRRAGNEAQARETYLFAHSLYGGDFLPH